QWLLSLGQAYLHTKEEDCASVVRDVIDEWIAANPYGWTVNWSVTMEVALRIITWSWLFHVFQASASWAAPSFRSRFLRSLYLHCEYTAQNLEVSEVNGNHHTADLAGLAIGGMFFGQGD